MGVMDLLGLGTFKHVRIVGDEKIEYFLHMKQGRGGTKLYYFDKKSKDAINLPAGYEVIVNPSNQQPLLKKLGH